MLEAVLWRWTVWMSSHDAERCGRGGTTSGVGALGDVAEADRRRVVLITGPASAWWKRRLRIRCRIAESWETVIGGGGPLRSDDADCEREWANEGKRTSD